MVRSILVRSPAAAKVGHKANHTIAGTSIAPFIGDFLSGPPNQLFNRPQSDNTSPQQCPPAWVHMKDGCRGDSDTLFSGKEVVDEKELKFVSTRILSPGSALQVPLGDLQSRHSLSRPVNLLAANPTHDNCCHHYQLFRAHEIRSIIGEPAPATLLGSGPVIHGKSHSCSCAEVTPTTLGQFSPSHQPKKGPPESPNEASPLSVSNSIASPSSSSS